MEKKALNICESIINRNIIFNNDTYGFSAGATIYRSLWSRDFLYSVPFLITYGEYRKYIKDHVLLIVSLMREDGMLPKGIDTMNMDWRVISGIFKRTLGLNQKIPEIKGPWKPLYKDALKSEAIDTNLLVMIALKYLEEYYPNILDNIDTDKIMGFYNKFIKDGLIVQDHYSDFQDSLRRDGVTFGTNLLYWKVLELYNPEKSIKEKLDKMFYDSENKVYKSYKNTYCIHENLLALYWNYFNDYNSVKEFFFDDIFPKPPTIPRVSNLYKPFTVIITNISGYHDSCMWSWILGLSCIVSLMYKDIDFSKRLHEKIIEMIIRDKTVYDAYTYGNVLKPLTSYAFKAEKDWTWGAVYFYASLLNH